MRIQSFGVKYIVFIPPEASLQARPFLVQIFKPSAEMFNVELLFPECRDCQCAITYVLVNEKLATLLILEQCW